MLVRLHTSKTGLLIYNSYSVVIQLVCPEICNTFGKYTYSIL